MLQRVRLWNQIFSTCQILIKDIYNVSDVDIKNFSTRHNLEQKIYNMTDLERKKIQPIYS